MNTKEQKLLDWLGRVEGNMLLESQVVGSGLSAALNELLLAGKVTIEPHPTVREGGSRVPAAAVVLVKP